MTKQQARGQPFDAERGRKGGQASQKHGVYAIKARGEEALDADQVKTLREIEAGLETPEGVVLAMRKRVAMSLMVLGVLESYLEQRINAGATPEGVDIFKSWPAFQNSAMRALAQLRSTMPKQDRADHAKLVGEMTERVERAKADAHAGQDEDPQPEAPETPQGANGSAGEGVEE